MGGDALQEHIYYKEINYKLKHNARYEFLVSYYIYHLSVLNFFY
jgi:hypothetical protein